MSKFPWQHREGHMEARVISETADAVTYEYRHKTVEIWKGRQTADKAAFNRAFILGDAA